MTVLKASSGGSTPVNFELGWHQLKIESIVDTTSEEYGAGLNWTFEIRNYPAGELLVDEKDIPWKFKKITSTKMGKSDTMIANARQFIEGALGRELEEGEDVDIDALEGLSFLAMMDENEKGYPQILKQGIKLKIKPMLKAAAKAKGSVAVATAIADDDEDDA